MSWYRMHRGWMDHEIFDGEPYCRRLAFEWLIGQASHAEKTVTFQGQEITLQRGELVTSQAIMARKFGWSRQNVRTFMQRLLRAEMVTSQLTSQLTNPHTVITVCNYNRFQGMQMVGQPTHQPAIQPTEQEDINNLGSNNIPNTPARVSQYSDADNTPLPANFPNDWLINKTREVHGHDLDLEGMRKDFRLHYDDKQRSDWPAVWKHWVKNNRSKIDADQKRYGRDNTMSANMERAQAAADHLAERWGRT